MNAQSATSELLRSTPSVRERRQPKEIDWGHPRPSSEPALRAQLQQKDILLREMQHRVANSLQIIATVLALDARKAQSEEARMHLQNAQRRILAVAMVQRHLGPSGHGENLELAGFLHELCEGLTASLVGDTTRITITVGAEPCMVSSKVAMSLGLIVTELVINALKHAFPPDAATGLIVVTHRAEGEGWMLAVSDNGVGKPDGEQGPASSGLGATILEALVKQLDGRMQTSSDRHGRSVTIAHGLSANVPGKW
jgi:chemotaxis protein methyltransferase CheR